MYRRRFEFCYFNLRIFLLTILVLIFSVSLVSADCLLWEESPLPSAPASFPADYFTADRVHEVGESKPGGQINLIPGLLLKAVDAGGAEPESILLEAWSCIKPVFVTREEVQELAQKVAATMKINLSNGLTNLDDQNFHAAFWEGEIEPGVALFFSVQSIGGTEGSGETYLLINLEGHPSRGEKQILNWRQKMQTAFLSWQVQPRFTYSLAGSIPGRLTPEERHRRADAVLASLEAQALEEVEEAEFLSISAYSSFLPVSLNLAGRPINANIALRYHDADACTYLYLGYPLLGGEY